MKLPKKVSRRVILIIVFVILVLGGGLFVYKFKKPQPQPDTEILTLIPSYKPKSSPKAGQDFKLTKDLVTLSVPFLAQAPFGEWSDPRQQDGCEEASVIMAMHWVRGTKIESKEAGKNEILTLSHYQEDNFGFYHDTSAYDTAKWMIEGYYNYKSYELKYPKNAEDIINELVNGNLIIVPSNGKALGNPNFTAGGPDRHMLVVKGYNRNTSQFITNDPGTRQGENYRYNKEVLFNAVRDYTTGYHAPIEGDKKVMIVVKK